MSAWPHVPFDLQGHRGARGLAPESTIASFDAAIAHGLDPNAAAIVKRFADDPAYADAYAECNG